MLELWFAIVAVMLTLYVVLDGFDMGAGMLHLLAARTDGERRQVLAAIGPYWDGNEVWLLAMGGALFVAFPRVLASGLSGFYFAIFLVLWCLILRGAAIEFRSHVAHALWRAFWDAVFGGASALLAVFFGAALGNLLRGLPLDGAGWFSLALFTDFSARLPVGLLDWYTVLVGVYALVALAAHGAAYLAWRTDGPVQERGRAWRGRLAPAVVALWPVMTAATVAVDRELFANFAARPVAWGAAAVALGGAVMLLAAPRRGADRAAFLGSCAFLAGLLGATAAALFPVLLRCVGDPGLSLTVHNSANDTPGLRIALGWWIVGFPLALLYFAVLFRLHRGKAVAAREGEGY
jgi:cytochrome d ubiquinol oxidase subunit II